MKMIITTMVVATYRNSFGCNDPLALNWSRKWDEEEDKLRADEIYVKINVCRIYRVDSTKGVFRTHSKIYGRAF